MDFFDRQAAARKSSKLLVVFFVIGVLGVAGSVGVLASWAIANPSPIRVAVEFRVHLKAPGNAPVPRTSSIESGRPITPPQSIEAGSGRLPILTVEQSTTRGLYEMSCRVVDSSTGLLLAEDLYAFRVQ